MTTTITISYAVQCHYPDGGEWRDELKLPSLIEAKEYMELRRQSQPARQFRVVVYRTTMEVMQEPQP